VIGLVSVIAVEVSSLRFTRTFHRAGSKDESSMSSKRNASVIEASSVHDVGSVSNTASRVMTGIVNYASDCAVGMRRLRAVLLFSCLTMSSLPTNLEAGSLTAADSVGLGDRTASSVVIPTTRDSAQTRIEIETRHHDHSQGKLVTLDPAEPSIASPAEPFGLNTMPAATGDILTKWSSVENDISVEKKILTSCGESTTECPLAAQKFLAIVAEGRKNSGRARIGVINRAINLAIRPMSDLAQWGVEDRWTAPLATLTSGLGDCEDYAIVKYVALTEAGVAAEDVKLVVVRDLGIDKDHAVVAARLDGLWLILDNRRLALVNDIEMRRVLPLFVLDSDGVKKFIPSTIPDTGYARVLHEAQKVARKVNRTLK
jgi:predicted transglutaminase-like cysteine proteinase